MNESIALEITQQNISMRTNHWWGDIGGKLVAAAGLEPATKGL
jgi:hypothetical protein